MSESRSTLKSNETALVSLKKQSVFTKTKSVDYVAIEKQVQEMIAGLPKITPEHVKAELSTLLRKTCVENDKDVNAFINNPQAFEKLMAECGKQAVSNGFDFNAMSITEFFKLIGAALISTKLNKVFPALGLLAMQVAPAAAASKPIYVYHEGQPAGAMSLCAGILYDCIEGYMTAVGQEWQPDMLRIVRYAQQNGTSVGCVTQQDLESMCDRAYWGPNSDTSTCTMSITRGRSGDFISVAAYSVDGITCDIMKDELVRIADECPLENVPPGDLTALAIAMGVIGGIAALALLAFGLCKYLQYRQHGLCLTGGTSVSEFTPLRALRNA